jgi:hypothetical protein
MSVTNYKPLYCYLCDDVGVCIFQPFIEGDLAGVGLVNGDKKVPSKCNTILSTKKHTFVLLY